MARCAISPERSLVQRIHYGFFTGITSGNATELSRFSSKATRRTAMLFENLIPLAALVAVIFGVLWLIIEAASLIGDRRS